MKKFIFDSSALIPASKYVLNEKSVCEHLADYVEIHIPAAVHRETLAQPEKFSGSAVLQNLMAQNKIITVAAAPANGITTDILSTYRLGPGEQEAILLYLQNQEKFDGIILDDYVATIVCRRLQISALLLLDLIVQLEREQIMPHALAVELITKIAPRYHRGFIEHSLQMLGEPKTVVEPAPVFAKENLERFLAGKIAAAPWWQRFASAHRDYVAGLISLGWMAQNLHSSVCDIERIFDEIKLPLSVASDELFELWEPHRASSRWLKSNREAN